MNIELIGRGFYLGIKTVFITGGAKGIGKAVAIMFAKKGLNLAINFRSSKKEAERLAVELHEKYGVKVLTIQGNVSIAEDCKNMVTKTIEQFGSIDIFIHNAGPYIKERKRIDEYEVGEWEELMNGNLNSAFYLLKFILPIMRRKKFGRIITLGFDRVETNPGWIFRSAFASSKAGLASLTRTIALEEAQNGITANMVCPGDIKEQWKEESIEQAKKALDELVPIGRPGTGQDISRTIEFLTSDSGDFITGTIIPVTGGQDVLRKYFYT
jgi:3-oxoacyl-[acyl-carrier protein] reductase